MEIEPTAEQTALRIFEFRLLRCTLPLEHSPDSAVMELIGKILQRIIRSSSSDGAVWGLYARLNELKGDLTMCAEAFLKQVRSYQSSEAWKDKERFKKYVHASLDLCKAYIEIFLTTGSRRELMAAEMHLRNIIKQAVDFSETDDYRSLQAWLDEVRNLRPVSSPYSI